MQMPVAAPKMQLSTTPHFQITQTNTHTLQLLGLPAHLHGHWGVRCDTIRPVSGNDVAPAYRHDDTNPQNSKRFSEARAK